MTSVTIALSFAYGYLSKIESYGGSVAKASAPKVSMIKLTHNI